MIRTFPSLLHRLRREDGVAMTIAVGAISALALFGASSIAFSTENYGNASRSKADLSAFALAEAGINNAVAVIANPENDPTNGALLPGDSESYESGSATWSGVYDTATSTWTITATGEMRNPTGPNAAPVRRTITAKVPVTPGQSGPVQPLANDAWNYDVATRTGTTGGCDEALSSNVIASAPLYVFGNVCLGAGAQITAGPLAVKGSATLGTGASIGSLTTPVNEVHIGAGCGGTICSASTRVFASLLSTSPPVLSAPTPDWDFWYQNASPGPKAPCQVSSGTPLVFDNNSARDKSVTTVQSLTPLSSYTCQVGPAANPTGELSWNPTTRVLTIEGTVFVDGQVKIDNARVNTYRGQGVIYTSGSFSVQGSTKMCAVVAAGGADCDFTPGAWDPNVNLLAVVSNGNGGISVLSGNSVQIGCLDRFQGALFGTNAVYFSAGTSPAKHQGPIVASTIVLSSSAELKPFGRLRFAPAGLPGQPSVSHGGVGRPQYITG